MYKGKNVAVVMPAYNAAKTIERSFAEVCEQNVADTVVIVDDCSRDETVAVANGLSHPGVKVVVHVLVGHQEGGVFIHQPRLYDHLALRGELGALHILEQLHGVVAGAHLQRIGHVFAVVIDVVHHLEAVVGDAELHDMLGGR
jgi:hypothetical protein